MFYQHLGRKVYYETAGSGDPFLLLHGWGVDATSLRPIFLFAHDALHMRPIAIDFPGHGMSEPPDTPWGAVDFSSLVLGLLDRLALPQVDILAHSFGGRIAAVLAAEHPERVRRLVLVGSAGIRPPRRAAYHTRVGLFKVVKVASKVLPVSAAKHVRNTLLGRAGSVDYRTAGELRPTFVRVVNEDQRDTFPRVKCPTLLIWGANDRATPLSAGEAIHSLVPGSEMVVLPNAGHYAWVDDWAGFSRALREFLERRK